jgi:hypothetical protein
MTQRAAGPGLRQGANKTATGVTHRRGYKRKKKRGGSRVGNYYLITGLKNSTKCS